jgi:hypothetical protein
MLMILVMVVLSWLHPPWVVGLTLDPLAEVLEFQFG